MARKVISKEELLDIASKIIKEEGIKGCSVRKLAKSAGIGTGTIYNYFPSQKEFLQDIFFRSWSETITNLKPIVQLTITPEDKIREFGYRLRDDIIARKGIGKELYGIEKFNSEICKSHKDIFTEITELIYIIIHTTNSNKKRDKDNLLMVSRWILMILINSIISKDYEIDRVINEINLRFL